MQTIAEALGLAFMDKLSKAIDEAVIIAKKITGKSRAEKKFSVNTKKNKEKIIYGTD